MKILTVAFVGEGPTDERFFKNIIERTIFELLREFGEGEYEINVVSIKKESGKAKSAIEKAALKARHYPVLVFHCDADDADDRKAWKERLQPGFELVENFDGEICRNLVALIPVQETEAWLLADKELLKSELGTSLNDQDLGLNYRIQQIPRIANPKQRIQRTIDLINQNLPRKRRRLMVSLNDLYEPLSQKLDLNFLSRLSSYQKFNKNLKTALQRSSYIYLS